jgi:hypothetical protein
MRKLTAVAVLVLVGCASAPETKSGTQSVIPADDVEFLITSAAADFHSTRPSDPGRFRNVRAGRLASSTGETRSILCGEFLAGGNNEWVHFATIRTSGYEQWLGRQSLGFCTGQVKWDKREDLSAALQKQLQALR